MVMSKVAAEATKATEINNEEIAVLKTVCLHQS